MNEWRGATPSITNGKSAAGGGRAGGRLTGSWLRRANDLALVSVTPRNGAW
ncbi:hypothetical protein B7P43_G09857 [Cryptotermes secundus]|uniref:Uncharacterized protein n=1 Tax=Cryptotermes secundus TaxID=105785 RepID=A0A2J7PC49_9NEOP|nr:hypothetical protein B7P43_G09857 [Cryptotermes secundus]